MNNWAYGIIALFVAWSVVSWQWYTCQIKGFCTTSVEQVAQLPEAPVQELTSPVQKDEVVPVAVAAECEARLNKHIKRGAANDAGEVRKLEQFLNNFQGEKLAVDGVYDDVDELAVKRFQEKYRAEVLTPWDLAEPTGFVYKTTRQQINKLYCASK